MKSAILSIGTELLMGQITNTNSVYLSQELNGMGIDVMYHYTVGDNPQRLEDLIRMAFKDCDLIIATGGLGPTKDDITKKALSDLSGAKGIKTDERQLEIIHKILSARGLDILDVNRAQADVPDTCEVIPNRLGTAPNMVFRFDSEMLECSGEDAPSGLAHDCKPYIIILQPLEQIGPTRIHLELRDEGVDFLPINRLFLLKRSCDSCSEEGFVKICNQTFNLFIHIILLLYILYRTPPIGYNITN